MKTTPGSIVAEPHEHVILTGPISGTVTTNDGETFNVSDVVVVVPEGKVEEVAHLVGARYAAEGHPENPDYAYDIPKQFAKYVPHADNTTLQEG